MSDGLIGPDGERLAPYLRRHVDMRSDNRGGSGNSLRIGLVIAVHHKDAPTGNRNGSYAEYDIVLMNHLACLDLYNVPVLGFHLALDSGECQILKACTSLPDMSDETTFYQNFLESDGDLVVIGYVDGHAPIIMGTANHIRSGTDTAPWHSLEADGETRKVFHKDSHILMKSDGSMDIEIKDEQAFTVTINGTQIFKLFYDAVSGDLHIELGEGITLEKMLLAETFQTWWDLNVPHNHILGGSTGVAAGHTHTLVSGTLTNEIPVFPGANLSDKTKNY